MGTMIEFKGAGGQTIPAYTAMPPSGSGPGVCIGHDIFGMGESQRVLADLFAANGYNAMVPDVFWDIDPKTTTDDKGVETTSYRETLDTDTCFDYFRAAMDHLRGMDECNGKVATIGVCFGGNLAFLSVIRHDADAVATYYGTRIQDYLDEAPAIKKPVLLHMSEHDHTYSDADRDRIVAAFKDSDYVTTHVYAERHGFAHRLVPEPEDGDAKAVSHARTFALFGALKDT